MAESPRPDPDALLRRLQRDEARAQRGKLKVFFGFAPGVGKTYRMLQVARDLVADSGIDVVVGLVETHRRPDTAALLLGLEILARRPMEYRGHRVEEFDLDAALARRPAVLVLDELAHSNAEGSRHAKRWQDVLELLDAGIDVVTTMNVQHVESLNDVVAQITHVRVRETVPDSILEQANAIESVDVAPEELLARLWEGKIYLGEQAERAAAHFFKRGNLLALRELALRQTAQHVDDDVLEYRQEHGVAETWPSGERLLVCVGPAPSSARLIRSAARIASQLHCPWTAAYVDPSALTGASASSQRRLEEHLRLAESLGGSVARLSGPRVAAALLDYARRENVTRLVVGKPTHSRLRDLLRGSLVDEVVRGSGDIEVHVLSGDGEAPREAPTARRGLAAPGPSAYVTAFLLVLLTTGIAVGTSHLFALPDLDTLYVMAAIIAALRLGRGPAIATAVLSIVAYDLFLVPPLYALTVDDTRYFLTFAMLLGLSVFVSELTTRLKRQETSAVRRERQTAALYALSRDLGAVDTPTEVAKAAALHAASSFSGSALVFCASESGQLELLGNSSRTLELDAKAQAVVDWCFDHARWAGIGTDTLPGSGLFCVPLVVGEVRLGVLALGLGSTAALESEPRTLLEAYCTQIALAFERARLSSLARTAELRARAEEVRSSMLSSVSHDLRTPLGAITGAASSLGSDQNLSPATRGELLQSISNEAERLERLVTNLLDMTRLESGGVSPKSEWLPLEEVVGSALNRLDRRLGSRAISVEIPDDFPLLFVDPVLFEQIFINLLENAAKYTPADSKLEIGAERRDADVRIHVRDHGPGIEQSSQGRIFEKFFRGAHPSVAGAGLGLAISRGIARAHRGDLTVQNAPSGGASFELTLPLPASPPPAPEASTPSNGSEGQPS